VYLCYFTHKGHIYGNLFCFFLVFTKTCVILQEKFQQSKNFGKVFEEKKEMEVHLSKLHQENVFLKESLDKFDEEVWIVISLSNYIDQYFSTFLK